MYIESLNLCENTRACLDPQLKDYGLVDFTLTYLSAETRVNEAQTTVLLINMNNKQ